MYSILLVSVIAPKSIYYRCFYYLEARLVQRDPASPLQASYVNFCWPNLSITAAKLSFFEDSVVVFILAYLL